MVGEWHGGKGSKRRNSNDKAYADGWDKIFGKGKKTKEKNKPTGTGKVKKDI